tara:strand:- start:28 stop:831 length:804 start_codon:yes stop_codon:yes gene_type:complete
MSSNFLQPISNGEFMIKFLLVVVCSVINILAINNYAFDNNGKLVCDNYVLNTYLYVVLAFVIMGAIFIIDEKIQLMFKILGLGMIGFGILILLFVIELGLVIALQYIDDENVVASHAVWISLISILGFLTTVTLYFGALTGTLYQAIVLTILITIATGYIGYHYGDKLISVDFEKYLTYALFALVIAYFVGPFLVKDLEKFYYVMAGIGLVIFVLLLLAYNKNIRIRAAECKVPNYPKESFGLIIKIVNILQKLITLLSKGKVKGRK